MNPPVIDTSALLTMLGIIAAVWAIVPATTRQTFRLSFNWFDWLLIITVTLVIHVLVFEQVLMAVDLYPVLGQWIWGFDKNGLLYLLFLLLALYILIRSMRTRLSSRSMPLLSKLVLTLLHARKFDELCALLEPHLATVLGRATQETVRHRLAQWLRPSPLQVRFIVSAGRVLRVDGEPLSKLKQLSRTILMILARVVSPSETAAEQARSTAKLVLSSRKFVSYLARAYPYLCLEVMDKANMIVDDFQDVYFEALLEDESSVLYTELKNNQNLARGYRYQLPVENQLLSFYFGNIEVAARIGVYRSVGEAVLSKISYDRELVELLNGPMITYKEVGQYRCPVSAGVFFFRIMVLQGLHEKLFDHLWLHYIQHFVDRILEYSREVDAEDEDEEHPTPFGFLLYQIVAANTAWIKQAIEETADTDVITPDESEGVHIYIAFEAAAALGGVMQAILLSDKVTHRLKNELLGTFLTAYRDISYVARLASLRRAMEKALVRPFDLNARPGYLETLVGIYRDQDYVLQAQTELLRPVIESELRGQSG